MSSPEDNTIKKKEGIMQTSFNQALAELLLEGIPDENIPQLYARDDVDLNDLIFVRPNI